MIPPCSRINLTEWASCSGIKSLNIFDPASVLIPAVWKMSFMPTGIPFMELVGGVWDLMES